MICNNYAIGIDVGGTWVRVALVDNGMRVINKVVKKTSEFVDELTYLTSLRKMIDQVDESGVASKIGMIVPTPYKEGMTHLQDATNVGILEGITLQRIRDFFADYDVYFENDVNVVALLESKIPVRSRYESLVYITVSTGIGSGIIINNQIWHGANGYAGEVGNMIVSQRDKNVLCVLEDVCSGLALDVAAQTFYGKNATSKSLFEAYMMGDEWAIETIDAWFEAFTDALASLMHVINPDVFVLGGAVIDNNDWLIEELLLKTRPKLFENLRDQLVIEGSHYGSDSGILGGAQLCF